MQKFLVIQTAFIGDAILTLPMIQKLKDIFPDTLIDIICIPSTKEIFSASPFINDVIILDKKNKHKSFFSLFKFSRNIKRKNYDRIYSPHRSFRTALIILFSGVKETFGFSSSSLKSVYKNLIEYKIDHHEVQRNLDLIDFKYKNDNWKILPLLSINSEEKKKVDKFILEHNLTDFICVAPGSVWNTKIYPEEYYKKIVNYFLDKSFQIVLIGSRNDEELCRTISGNASNTFIAAGKFSLTESVELLKRSKLLISNDSAPTHLAMCADIPTLTLYCSTVADFGFYPYNKTSEYLSFDDLSCKPCGIHGYNECPIKTFACGYNLKPETVINKIEEMLNDKNKKIKDDKY